ncbi:hypothetical protein HDU83_000005 [Entophlyctis luteolus]|nr:hypothetical protein HDU83_000005 [Entophlyctis luteolus]
MVKRGRLLLFSAAFRRSFDTLAFARRAEEPPASLGRTAAEALLDVSKDAVAESLGTVVAAAPTRSEYDRRIHAHTLRLNQLRADLGLLEKNDFVLLQADVARVGSEVDRLHLRTAEEFRRIQANARLEISMEKARIREEQNAQAIRMKEADAKIESELAAIKTVLEGIRWDLFRSLFPLFSAAGALAFSKLFIYINPDVHSRL